MTTHNKSGQDPRLPGRILRFVISSTVPLGTRQIAEKASTTEYKAEKILYDLLADGKVSRLRAPGDRGPFMWWRPDAYGKVE
jgi:hypothetical protein